MTLTHGADADRLRQIAEAIREQSLRAARLRAEGAARAGVLVEAWQGEDLAEFTGRWRGAERALDACAERLVTMARLMAEQAEQQDEASGAGPGGVAHAGVPAAARPAPAGPVDAERSPFDERVRGTEGQPVDKDLWALAHHAYGPDNDLYDHPVLHDEQPDLPAGYAEVEAEEARTLGLDPATFDNAGSGLETSLYRTPDGGYVLAFRGSDEGADWGTNLGQGLGLADHQYEQAMQLASSVDEATGGRVTFTGHSLGGGLAAAAGLATGQPAVTFDAGGVHEATAERAAEIRGDGTTAEGVLAAAEQGQMRTYSVETDILTNLQEGGHPLGAVMPDAPGSAIELETPQSPQRELVLDHYGDMGAGAGAALGGLVGGVGGAFDGDLGDVDEDVAEGADTGAELGRDLGRFGADQAWGHHWDPMSDALEERYPGCGRWRA